MRTRTWKKRESGKQPFVSNDVTQLNINKKVAKFLELTNFLRFS